MVPMTPNKQRRLATAAGFLAGVLGSLDALRDAKIFWPPDAAWEGLQSPQRLELGAGIVLVVVTLVTSAMRPREM
jgi:hypothetical protein